MPRSVSHNVLEQWKNKVQVGVLVVHSHGL